MEKLRIIKAPKNKPYELTIEQTNEDNPRHKFDPGEMQVVNYEENTLLNFLSKILPLMMP